MDPGYVLRVSTSDGDLVGTLLGPDGAQTASSRMALDSAALQVASGPTEYGEILASALLTGPVAAVLQQAGEMRVRLAVDREARDLYSLRWECLARRLRSPLSRLLYPNSRDRAHPAQTEWPLRILVAISNPANLGRFGLSTLDVDLEWTEFQRALRPLQGLVEVELVEPPVTLDRIHLALEQEPAIFHYLGHGAYDPASGDAALFLEKEGSRQVDPITDKEWVQRLGALACPPHLMVLAACESAVQVNQDAMVGLAPALVKAGAGAVVAMRDKVGIDMAREFVYHFYRRLATHGEIDLATSEARAYLYDRGGWSWAIPTLFLEWGAERIFATPPSTLEAPPAKAGETLILIPEFQGHESAYFETGLHQRLQGLVSAAGLGNVRVVWLKRTSFGPGDDDEVRRLAARYGAALVLWGWYDRSRFRACFSVTESLFAYRDPTVFRSGSSVGTLFQSENDFRIYVNYDLPRQIEYFALFTLGQIYYWEGNYDAALAALDQAIAAVEGESSDDRPDGLAHAYFYRGYLYAVHRQDRPAAIADYRQALSLDPAFTGAAFNLGDALRIWANTCRADGDEDTAHRVYQEAIEVYDQALCIDADYVPAYERRALARFEIGEFQKAAEDYEEALARNPQAETYFQLGLTLRSLRRWDQSLAAQDLAISRAPGIPRYYFGRGRLHNALGDQDGAMADFQTYLRLAPRSESSTRARVAAWIAEHGMEDIEMSEEVDVE